MKKHSIASILVAPLIIILFVFGYRVHADTLSVTTDRTEVQEDDTLQLRVRHSGGQTQGSPDFSALNKDFEILTRQQSNQFRSFNGRTEAFTDWLLEVIPRRTGRLMIPAFEFNGAISQPLHITVKPAGPAPQGASRSVFIETEISKQDVFVQEQIVLHYRLYYSVNVDDLNIQPIELDNAIVEELPSTQYKRSLKGKVYHVAEFSYAIYPQKSGKLSIPAYRWQARILAPGSYQRFFGQGMGRQESKRLHTEAKEITVKAQPSSFPVGATWLPAEKVTIEENWSQTPDNFEIGVPLTRTITLSAEGLIASQLPPILGENQSKDLKIYADQPQTTDDKSSSGVTARRIESAAVVVNTPGEITIPSIRIPWWNTKTNKLQYAEIPKRSFAVKGKALPVPPSASATPLEQNAANADESSATSQMIDGVSSDTNSAWPWQVATLISSLLSALLLILLFRQGKRGAPKDQLSQAQLNERAAFKNFQNACSANDALAARAAVLDWARIYWAPQRINTLQQLCKLTDDAQLNTHLHCLDTTLYAPSDNSAWQGQALEKRLRAWRKRAQEPSQKGQALTELYHAS